MLILQSNENWHVLGLYEHISVFACIWCSACVLSFISLKVLSLNKCGLSVSSRTFHFSLNHFGNASQTATGQGFFISELVCLLLYSGGPQHAGIWRELSIQKCFCLRAARTSSDPLSCLWWTLWMALVKFGCGGFVGGCVCVCPDCWSVWQRTMLKNKQIRNN